MHTPHAKNTKYTQLPQEKHAYAHVWRLWAAVVVLSLLEAVVFSLLQRFALPDIARRPAAAVYVAANVFVFFAALLVLLHVAGRTWMPHPDTQINTANAKKNSNTQPTELTEPAKLTPSARAELTHLFLHLLCLAYLRTACWFEGRAAMRWFFRS
jgi:hypothetical protein